MNGRRWVCLAAILAGVIGVAQPPPDALVVRIGYVVDGDTAVVSKSGVYLRYLGINAPEEGEPFYYAAKAANRDLVWRRDVYLEFGPERYDAYGRLLAYLWVEKDGQWVLVNEELLRRGLARLLVLWPKEDRHYERLRRAQTLAQVEKLGLWSAFPDPMDLSEVEGRIVECILQAVTVGFTVGRVEESEDGWTVWAADSRYGFHAVVAQEASLSIPSPPKLIGHRIAVTGQLEWPDFQAGPRIWVGYPEQLQLLGAG
ncbi:thermonuclease family protein [Candidatus Bipolaricaulota bacterium]|nr:thermonuclease family protein [Candidatus Bipolaricaulota bacterium]